jgi:hypothetical protein
MTSATNNPRRTTPLPGWVLPGLPAAIRDDLPVVETFLRHADEVLSPAALHTMTSTRLSFANTLVEKMATERWQVRLGVVQIAADGTGFLSFEINAAGHEMSFGVQANPPMDVDRVSLFRDTETDYFAALLDGRFDRQLWEQERDQFEAHLWRGRAGDRVFGWTIARRGRAFEPTIQALAAGRQPPRELILRNGGYLLRNGGYYGNGRMGTRAWRGYAYDGWPFQSPYHVDLLTLYLWRLVGFVICDAAARARSKSAVQLRPQVKRYLGVGNSSGLGTVAALVRWPERLSSFILPREIALAYATSRRAPLEPTTVRSVAQILLRAAESYALAPDPGEGLVESRHLVAAALRQIAARTQELAGEPDMLGERPWQRLLLESEELDSREAVDLLRSFLVDAYPETGDLRRVPALSAAQPRQLQPEMTIADLRLLVETRYSWVLQLDFTRDAARHFFWYRSEENGENRRGERSVDIGVERETFIDVAGSVRRLYDFLQALPEETTVGEFLLGDPEHTLAVQRVQTAEDNPYSEVHADICAEDFLASDGIRTFLAILGLETATPASRRWVRGVFFRGAPLPEDLEQGIEEDWRFPAYEDSAAASGGEDAR